MIATLTEHLGRARDFRRRVLAEDAALLTLSHKLVVPLVARIKRHPRRSVRPEKRAERTAGELLATMRKAKAGRPPDKRRSRQR
jgi:hypothetical protein